MYREVNSKYIIQRAIDDIGEPMSNFYKNNKEVIANWVFDAMRIIGNFPLLEDKTQEYHVTQYEVLLPCDYIQEIKVVDSNGRPLRHYDKNFDVKDMNTGVYRYINRNGKLMFNHKELDVILYYRGIRFDEEGYVIIYDDEHDSQTRAIVQYIAMMLTKREARKGNPVSMQMLQFDTQEWHRLCANAGAHRYMPKTLAEHHAIGLIQRAFVLNYNDYLTNFRDKSNTFNKFV